MAPTQTLEPENPQEALKENRTEFEKAVPWGKELTRQLEADRAELTHVRPAWGDYVWFLRALVPFSVQEGFGTAPEILIIAIRGKIQAKDLERAHSELYLAGFRLDLDLLVIAEDQPNLETRLSRLPGRWGQFIPWPPSKENTFTSLFKQFSIFLPRFDLFEERNPVRGRHVIGRTDEVSDVTTRIENGDCVGIFGLRKVGKTSVVRAATDALDPISARLSLLRHEEFQSDELEPRAVVAWIDIQRIYKRTREQLFSHLIDAIELRLRAGQVPYSRPSTQDPIEQVDQILRSVLRELDIPICIVIDEYDFLFEGSNGESPIDGITPLFQLFRGISQETRRLSLVVIGRDPSFFQRPEMGGFPNPMLGWFATQWIGPLRQDKAPELLRKLGKRVGLEIGHRTASLAQTWTGGHPLLHRQFGSALLEMSRHHGSTNHVLTDPFCEGAVDRFRERDAVREICQEITHLLRTRFESSYSLILDIARGSSPKEAIQKHGGWNSNSSLVLRKYGILTSDAERPSIFQALTSYVEAFDPSIAHFSLPAPRAATPTHQPTLQQQKLTPQHSANKQPAKLANSSTTPQAPLPSPSSSPRNSPSTTLPTKRRRSSKGSLRPFPSLKTLLKEPSPSLPPSPSKPKK